MVNCKHQESGWEGGKPLGRLVCDPEQEAMELWLEVGPGTDSPMELQLEMWPGMDSQPHRALAGGGAGHGQSAPWRFSWRWGWARTVSPMEL